MIDFKKLQSDFDSIESIMETIKSETNKYLPVTPTPEEMPSETNIINIQELTTPEGSDNIAFIPEVKNVQYSVISRRDHVSNKTGAEITASCILSNGDIVSIKRKIGEPLE